MTILKTADEPPKTPAGVPVRKVPGKARRSKLMSKMFRQPIHASRLVGSLELFH